MRERRLAPRGSVLDADDVDRFDALADGGQRQRKFVHHEAGIDAGAEERDVVRAGDLLQLVADRVIERKRQLFARRNDVAAAFEQTLELRRDFVSLLCSDGS